MVVATGRRIGSVASQRGRSRSAEGSGEGALKRATIAGPRGARSRGVAPRQLEREGGIDTDRELQALLLVEQHYGANARVVQAVDGMLQRLMEI